MRPFRTTSAAITLIWIGINVIATPCSNGQCDEGYKCVLDNCVLAPQCPEGQKFGPGPPATCSSKPTDPLNKPKSKLESWFTKEMFNDLFPKANIGWGPNECFPYSYESFIIAARYFPKFATESPSNGLKEKENWYRDLAAFFAHAVQETGENDASLYQSGLSKEVADACFYRGGFFNWFEGGPTSLFLPTETPGHSPTDGDKCVINGRYCISSTLSNYFYKCSDEMAGSFYKGCYFGRGAIQLSYNFNYGPFNRWLNENGIKVDLLKNPNLIMTKMDPPLAIMGSIWFYMTPQPPKPAMHDIVIGAWEPGETNRKAGYYGPIFGPTSLIINNECGGEDHRDPGGPGESRRIKAFKWFTNYFGVSAGKSATLTCKGMPKLLDQITHNLSYQPASSGLWKDKPCKCAPSPTGGPIGYYQDGFYPKFWTDQNAKNKAWCERVIYEKPDVFGIPASTNCLKFSRKKTPTRGPRPVVTTELPRPVTGSGGTGECPSNTGMFPYPNDCSKYILCNRGKATIFSCAPGLHFGPTTKRCDWPSAANCQE